MFSAFCCGILVILIAVCYSSIRIEKDNNGMQRKIKNKVYQVKRCRKLNSKIRTKRRHRSRSLPSKSAFKRVVAPSVLSIFEETEDTLSFFDQVKHTISTCEKGNTIYFDLSEIEQISPDAIMYLIAIIKNNKKLRLHGINCVGNLPKNEAARNVFQQVGFLRFVEANISSIKTNTNYMKIETGKKADGELAGAFCRFTNGSENQTKATKQLYRMLVELMTNTFQHAYNGETIGTTSGMISNWYLFAERHDDGVHFVFLDTGEGIPRTVAKRFLEKVADRFSFNSKDADYLMTALTGEYPRSETGQVYRGKGLPGIYEDCKAKKIDNLKIISCKAICTVSEGSVINCANLKPFFEGTLFSWRVV